MDSTLNDVCVNEGESIKQTQLHFNEISQLLQIIGCTVQHVQDTSTLQSQYELFTKILNKYQEQPNLIDSYVETIVRSIFKIINDEGQNHPVTVQCFKYLYVLLKVGGSKRVSLSFSHDYTDLIPVMNKILNCDSSKYEEWEMRYVLLLWLSSIVVLPFDLSKFNNKAQTDVSKTILQIGMTYSMSNDKSLDAVPLLIARLIARPDTFHSLMPDYYEWSIQCLNDSRNFINTNNSKQKFIKPFCVLRTLATIFDLCDHNDLIEYADKIISSSILNKLISCKEIVVRHMVTKLAQRVGLLYLRRNSFTESNILPRIFSNNDQNHIDESNSTPFDIPPQLNDIIQVLIQSLEDNSISVRWSSAKGFGRISMKIDWSARTEIFDAIYSFFNEGTNRWNGACLALAEIARRSMIHQDRFEKAIEMIEKALNYEERQGTMVVGEHTRDACCYSAWAIARTVNKQYLCPFANRLAKQLILSSLFDRILHCRRAAAAALQEFIGRQGSVSRGLDLVSIIDYYAVGQKRLCYSDLCIKVASFEEYRSIILDYIINNRICHWDNEIGELASESLSKLIVLVDPYDQISIMNNQMNKLSEGFSTLSIHQIRGIVSSIGKILLGLSKQEKLHFDMKEKYKKTVSIPILLFTSHYWKGLGSQTIKSTCLQFLFDLLSSINTLNIDLDWEDFEKITSILVTFFKSSEIKNMDCQLDTLELLCKNAVSNQNKAFVDLLKQKFCTNFMENLNSMAITSWSNKINSCSALSRLNIVVIGGSIYKAVELFIETEKEAILKLQTNKNLLVDIRCCIANCLTRLVILITNHYSDCSTSDFDVNKILQFYIQFANDYTCDAQGDIGSKVRKCAINALNQLFTHKMFVEFLLKIQSNSSLIYSIVGCFIKNSLSRIDKLRQFTSDKFIEIIISDLDIGFNEKIAIKQILEKNEAIKLNDPDDYYFKVILEFLKFEKLRKYVVEALIHLVGQKNSSYTHRVLNIFKEILLKSHEIMENCLLDKFLWEILNVFTNLNSRVNGLTCVQIRFLLNLMKLPMICNRITRNDMEEWLNAIALRLINIQKESCDHLLLSIELWSIMTQFDSNLWLKQKSLENLLNFLDHSFPIIRKSSANSLYLLFIAYDVESMKNIDEIISLLSETVWEANQDICREIKDKLFILLDLHGAAG